MTSAIIAQFLKSEGSGEPMRKLITCLQSAPTIKAAIRILGEIGDMQDLPIVGVVENLSRTTLVEDEDGKRISEPFGWPADFVDRWLCKDYTLYHRWQRLDHLPYVAYPAAAAKNKALLPRQRCIDRELADIGVKSFLHVPIHLPRGRLAIVSWSTHKENAAAERALNNSCELMAAARFFMDLVLRREKSTGGSDTYPTLSRREVECLAWAAQGKSDRSIAAICGLSPATIRCYIDSASAKLGTTTRTQAVAVACELSLLHDVLKARH
jgi:DNA-binding CsgD family transcriptional regulator